MGYSHVYATVQGQWISGHWVGEIAQMGFRVTRWELNHSGPYITLPNLTDYNLVFEEVDVPDYHITRTFDGPFGIVDSIASSNVQDDLADDLVGFITALKTKMSSNFEFTTIKFALIEHGTGKYVAPSTVYRLKTPVRGSSTGALPPEVALAVSMRTGVVGKRGRGRVYVPALTTTSLTADGTCGSSTLSQFGNALATLIDDAANLPGIDQFSSGIVICSGDSTTAVVPKQVRVGNHFDVQRRRQHQVDETYTDVNI